jgi:hypothetical protein
MFFAEAQNKLIFAASGQTAAELIINRANANEPNMALTSWKGSIVRKQDIFIAKNYLSRDELDTLNRLIVIFLETAELRAKNRLDITLKFWQENIDRILKLNDKKILNGKGNVSNALMEQKVRKVYSRFDEKRKTYEARKADELDMKEIEELIKKQK